MAPDFGEEAYRIASIDDLLSPVKLPRQIKDGYGNVFGHPEVLAAKLSSDSVMETIIEYHPFVPPLSNLMPTYIGPRTNDLYKRIASELGLINQREALELVGKCLSFGASVSGRDQYLLINIAAKKQQHSIASDMCLYVSGTPDRVKAFYELLAKTAGCEPQKLQVQYIRRRGRPIYDVPPLPELGLYFDGLEPKPVENVMRVDKTPGFWARLRSKISKH